MCVRVQSFRNGLAQPVKRLECELTNVESGFSSRQKQRFIGTYVFMGDLSRHFDLHVCAANIGSLLLESVLVKRNPHSLTAKRDIFANVFTKMQMRKYFC